MAVCLDSDENSSNPPADQKLTKNTAKNATKNATSSNKRQKVRPMQGFAIGTQVRKVRKRKGKSKRFRDMPLTYISSSLFMIFYSTFPWKGGLMEKSARDDGMRVLIDGYIALNLRHGTRRILSWKTN